MTQTSEHKNKTIVLEAFDTLLNKRDYAAAGIKTRIKEISNTIHPANH